MHFRIVFSAAVLFGIILSQPVLGVLQFQKEFVNLYVGDDKDSDWGARVKEAKCFVCHQGKQRKNHNHYGEQLSVLLDKKKDAKNPEKIIEALEKVAGMHSVSGDEKSPTFGELIKAGKLPGGPLEDCKQEPKTPAE